MRIAQSSKDLGTRVSIEFFQPPAWGSSLNRDRKKSRCGPGPDEKSFVRRTSTWDSLRHHQVRGTTDTSPCYVVVPITNKDDPRPDDSLIVVLSGDTYYQLPVASYARCVAASAQLLHKSKLLLHFF